MTDCIMDRILKKVEVGKFVTTALKGILKLVKLQSLVAKCCKMRKILPIMQSVHYQADIRTLSHGVLLLVDRFAPS